MTQHEHKIVEEAHEWFQRLMDRDSISLNPDSPPNFFPSKKVKEADEIEYTINLIDRLGKIL